MKGDVDPGHKDAYEIFYVARGKILCNLPDEDLYEELEEGDAILIPPPRPHALKNMETLVRPISHLAVHVCLI